MCITKASSAFLKDRNAKQLLSNINENGDNNEKTKCLKTWVGIFRVGIFWVGIFRGGILQGEFDGWEFPGWEFSKGEFSWYRVNLHENTIKKFGIHYSYNKQLENDQNFIKYIAKIENMLKLWNSLEGKTTVFKSLALFKITHLALVKLILPSTIDQWRKIQKNFIWNRLSLKIKK